MKETSTRYQTRRFWVWWNRQANELTLESTFGWVRTTPPSILVLFNFWQEGFNQGIIAEAETQTLFCAQTGDCTTDLESRHSAVHDEDGFDEFCECFQIGGTCF